ncbi:lantibiotic biosynthesis protein [Streptomyces eurocidicus]|uniref:Lantibiotic biosynthesis protein n=1 Tax=Streptomyces eurocidicus TaxID=66423 RepID=A0A2N8P1G0_STREU|nr:lantibiotic dehydratase C-terminal domain-containing protein [Streptomyces eurocidicus]MBB5121811.1 thiopeptide-type bacteriocin biosynthesis protein [Streptomyces eurocidicus]MBF6055077.1 lantibiotic biosynthesis protein [Streptomyces eurocidicus]PNE34845.1 lantibiotic biosynthesis protein [Streptomyces eurocidicus]
MTRDPIRRPPAPAPTEGAWQALHVFYPGSPRPMLTRAVRPLLDALTAEGLVTNYFFLNYWLEGPHIRLRLKPVTPAAEAEVRARAETAVGDFLRTRPSLYEVKSDYFVDLYNTFFDREFTEEERRPYQNPDGRMRLRAPNTYSWEPYEPEYGKYGGPAGIALAEWHFRHSTDLVIDAMRTMNLQVRTVLLGFAAQLMMTMTAAFLDDTAAIADYLDRYRRFWQRAFAGTPLVADSAFDRSYEATGAALRTRFETVRHALATGRTGELPGFIRTWADHCTELRGFASELATRGDLEFKSRDGAGTVRVDDVGAALRILLSPYLHMTANRLVVTIGDEAYLAGLLATALRDGDGTGGA